MGYDVEQLKFTGIIHTIAEKELDASVSEDAGDLFVKSLYQEYVAEGKPRNQREWIRGRLKKAFVCVTTRPVWVGSLPVWPFFDGKPMTFIAQCEVAENEVSETQVSPGAVLYVFGARKQIPEGWEMVYQVVEQHHGL